MADDGDVIAEVLDLDVPELGIANKDGAGCGFVEPLKESSHSRLAGAGGPDDGDTFAFLDLDVDAAEDGSIGPFWVGEVDVVEGDGPGDRGLEDAARLVGGGCIEVDDLIEVASGLNGLRNLLS